MKLLVNASKFKSAAVCKACKDIRFYLNGVFLSHSGAAVGTDDHALVIASNAFVPPADFAGVIIALDAKVPAKCEQIEFDTQSGIARFLSALGDPIGLCDFKIIDGRYPDYYRVIPKKIEKIEAIGIDPELFSRAAKVFPGLKYRGVRLEFYGAVGAVKITHPSAPDVIMIVMPCTL